MDNDLLERYHRTKKDLDQLHAATKAVAKKLRQAQQEHERACYAVHCAIGELRPNTLVTNVSGTRYFEIDQVHSITPQLRYYLKPVQRTGKYGKQHSWKTTTMRLAGSILPVTNTDDPVYIKWQKMKVCQALEGKDHETV